MDIRVGDVITLKKQHPCGSKEWEVLRIGADFRLKCKGCDHQIMIPRPQVEKNVRNIMRVEESQFAIKLKTIFFMAEPGKILRKNVLFLKKTLANKGILWYHSIP